MPQCVTHQAREENKKALQPLTLLISFSFCKKQRKVKKGKERKKAEELFDQKSSPAAEFLIFYLILKDSKNEAFTASLGKAALRSTRFLNYTSKLTLTPTLGFF